jgi:hypothetical protein
MARLGAAALAFSLALGRAFAAPQDPPKQLPEPAEKQEKKDAKDQDSKKTQEVIVTGRSQDLTGVAESATEGKIGQDQLRDRVTERTGEVLETVPGLMVTQHSGGGKANQYFTRGFNLDHGTDFATWVNGMPINMPTHGHGQGYLDLNWLIPELIEVLDYHKGPYYAQETDFSAAGAAHIEYVTELKDGQASVSLGTDGYARGLAVGSLKAGAGTLLYGVEVYHEDGPWQVRDNYLRENLVLRYSEGNAQHGWNVTGMAYRGGPWTSTDQVARRAVSEGLIDRFGTLDPTDGGKTYRYSLSGEWHQGDASSMTRAHAYVIGYGLDLWSDFTYFLNDPLNGDQFEQLDRRIVAGGDLSREWTTTLFGMEQTTTLGFQNRNDDIYRIELYHTKARAALSDISLDRVLEDSMGLYLSEFVQILPWLRATLGLRGDVYHFDVTDRLLPQNTGSTNRAIASPKASIILGPWEKTEFYIQAGEGYHSNDARGVLAKTDPSTLLPFQTVTALVRAKGADIGARTTVVPGLQSSISFFVLDLASELVFDGDTASSVPSLPTRRYGVEFANYYRPVDWLTLDADLAYTQARFTESDPATPGRHVPEAVEGVAEAGVAADLGLGFFLSLRLRYFGPRALTQDNSVRSQATTLLNGRLGYRYQNITIAFECLNMAHAKASEIDYFYTSRLPGEPLQGVADVHGHPVEPREYRIGVSVAF